MYKTVKSIMVALFFMTAVSTADSTPPQTPNKPGDYHWQQIPAICGPEARVLEDLTNQGFVPVNMSLGRENSNPNGEPVFLITYFLKQDMTGTAATITIPTSNDACILYITHDLTFTSPE